MYNVVKVRSDIKPVEVRKSYDWITEKNKPMVTHNDLDGLLTALILHEYLGWNLVGMYDLTHFWLDKSFKQNPREAIYVDLDVTHKDFKSLGHHIIGEEKQHLNVNELFGITHKEYTSKYPLSTALFLYWLFEKKLPENDLGKLLLLHSDSAWKNYQQYTTNVTNWLNALGMDEMLYLLKNQNTFQDIESSVLPKIEEYINPRTNRENHQCSYTVRNGQFAFNRPRGKSVQDFVDFLADTLGFKRMIVPSNLQKLATFQRTTIDINKNNFNTEIDKMKSKSAVFSYSVKFRGKVDFSYYRKS